MDDLGTAISYLVVEKNSPVYTSDDKQIGVVHKVVADGGEDIFDGLEIKLSGHLRAVRYVDAEQIDKMYERGVVLKIDSAAAGTLPQPR